MATSAKKATAKAAPAEAAPKPRAARLNQADVPAYTLAEALRVAEALRDDYAKQPTTPLDVAKSLDMTPTSGTFRMLTGAAAAYGLTDGAAQGSLISLTDLGKRIIAPMEEGDDAKAMREAILKPRVIREFLEKYNGNALPQRNIALNVIEGMGVPSAVAERAYEMIINNAQALGLLMDLKEKKYVKLDAPAQPLTPATPQVELPDDPEPEIKSNSGSYTVAEAPVIPPKPPTDPATNNKVFITHGKNQQVVAQIKKILTYGKFEPIVSAQRETVSMPVPEKVMTDMRGCSAAIVQGVTLPSNLQGLYEVRYEGEQLEFDATMKLLEVFSTF